MLVSYLLVWSSLVTFFTYAQTITTTDPNSGQSIVEVVSINSLQGVSTTLTISTLTTQATIQTTQTTPTMTSPNNPQGPVGQPAPTTATPGAPTPFTFTTIINGQTVVSTDIFTPTNPATTPVVPTMSGTIWDLSSYLQKYGPTTTPVGAAAKAAMSMSYLIFLSVPLAMICTLEHLLIL